MDEEDPAPKPPALAAVTDHQTFESTDVAPQTQLHRSRAMDVWPPEDAALLEELWPELRGLGALDPVALAPHAGAIAARLDDSHDCIRAAALRALARLEPEALAPHAGAISAQLQDNGSGKTHGYNAFLALRALSGLEPSVLARHGGAVAACLETSRTEVRWLALRALRRLPPTALVQDADAVAARLRDADANVRTASLRALCSLEPLALSEHALALVAKLRDGGSEYELCLTLDALGRLEPEMLTLHAAVIIERLQDPHEHVRLGALLALGRLSPAALLGCLPDVLPLVENDPDAHVRAAALRLLGHVAPDASAEGPFARQVTPAPPSPRTVDEDAHGGADGAEEHGTMAALKAAFGWLDQDGCNAVDPSEAAPLMPPMVMGSPVGGAPVGMEPPPPVPLVAAFSNVPFALPKTPPFPGTGGAGGCGVPGPILSPGQLSMKAGIPERGLPPDIPQLP
eukprot:CAMPEP_0172827276 /NCGR_PEP_ID=MMETSP1075-20121228/19990_1 /TAXON_ID=2916 /ORGANISM="Ceratium fusus, Strain PA161109" /LENGTH=457 /DNA_ID=CAMNT_0013669057 /DNA_START=48 /DNA_END=1417 /DNA_ORIENTATION=-